MAVRKSDGAWPGRCPPARIMESFSACSASLSCSAINLPDANGNRPGKTSPLALPVTIVSGEFIAEEAETQSKQRRISQSMSVDVYGACGPVAAVAWCAYP
jgi:hypothetical protein